MITTDSREHFRDYDNQQPYFAAAPEALLSGLSGVPDLEVHVLSCAQRPMRSPAQLAHNIWFHGLHVPKIGWLRTGYQGCVRAVRRALHGIRPHLVHGQGTERDCAISAVLSGFPNVVTLHGNMAEIARVLRARPFSFLWCAAQLETFTIRRSDGVLCNSEYTRSLVESRTRRKWTVPNPIRASFFRQLPESRPSDCVITNIGVISARKRQVELLNLATELRNHGLRFRMDFVGTHDASPYAQQFLQGVEARREYVRYVGSLNTDEIIAQLDASAALLHFPMEEAFGLVVAEALARGVKLFASRTGGICDIASGIHGADLVDADDWVGLQQSIVRWIKAGFPRPQSASEVIRQRYHPAIIAERHLKIYQEVLSTRS